MRFFYSQLRELEPRRVELDPLLALLVEQGVITMEQALAVQAEYDRRREAEQAPAAVTPQPATAAPPPTAPAVPDQVAEATSTEAAPETTTTAAKEKWYDRFDFKGDLRLRAEFFKIEGISADNYRERFRARFRAGMYTEITDWMDVGFQLRSGDPDDPVSDNSTFDGGFALIPISISEAYAGFHPTGWLDLTVGKFDAQKKWVVSDMQWDDDVTVAGAMEEFSSGRLSSISTSTFWRKTRQPMMPTCSAPSCTANSGTTGSARSRSEVGSTTGSGRRWWPISPSRTNSRATR